MNNKPDFVDKDWLIEQIANYDRLPKGSFYSLEEYIDQQIRETIDGLVRLSEKNQKRQRELDRLNDKFGIKIKLDDLL